MVLKVFREQVLCSASKPLLYLTRFQLDSSAGAVHAQRQGFCQDRRTIPQVRTEVTEERRFFLFRTLSRGTAQYYERGFDLGADALQADVSLCFVDKNRFSPLNKTLKHAKSLTQPMSTRYWFRPNRDDDFTQLFSVDLAHI